MNALMETMIVMSMQPVLTLKALTHALVMMVSSAPLEQELECVWVRDKIIISYMKFFLERQPKSHYAQNN